MDNIELSSFLSNIDSTIVTIDSHTAGEATRLIVDGVGPIPGTTLAEKLEYFKINLDHVRRLLTSEPRGYGILGAMLTEGVSPGAHFGLIYMDARRYPYLCGHGTIGAVATLDRCGKLTLFEGDNMVHIDTPAGPMECLARKRAGRIESVTIKMVPSFVQQQNIIIEVEGYGKLPLDLVYAGGFFAMVNAAEIGLNISLDNSRTVADLGMRIIAAANQQCQVSHPLQPEVTTVDVAEFYDHPDLENMRGLGMVVYGDSHVDRSPCGTGTTAKLTLMHHKGEIKENQSFTNESPLKTSFQARIIQTTRIGSKDAVVVEVSGNAHITGVHQFILEQDDPFPQGFVI